MQVREATVADVALLVELNRIVQDAHRVGKPEHFRETEPVEVARWFRDCLEGPGAWAWLAVAEEGAVGYALAVQRERPATPFTVGSSFLELDQVVVQASRRRQGVARALVGCVKRKAVELDLREITLKSWHFNHEAHAVFRQLGFRPEVLQFVVEAE